MVLFTITVLQIRCQTKLNDNVLNNRIIVYRPFCPEHPHWHVLPIYSHPICPHLDLMLLCPTYWSVCLTWQLYLAPPCGKFQIVCVKKKRTPQILFKIFSRTLNQWFVVPDTPTMGEKKNMNTHQLDAPIQTTSCRISFTLTQHNYILPALGVTKIAHNTSCGLPCYMLSLL